MRERALITGIIILLGLLGAGAILTLRRLSGDQQRIVSIYERSLEEAVDAERLVALSERSARIVRSYLVAPEAERLEQLTTTRREFAETLERFSWIRTASFRSSRICWAMPSSSHLRGAG